jgi:ribosomal-protein-alanine N-acetyltransferase
LVEIRTERLVLRSWRESDIAPFAALCADPVVMAYFERPRSFEEAEATARRCMRSAMERGFCLWAVEVRGEAAFIGFTGIDRVADHLPFAPAVEIGGRLARPFWGRGFASEAARAALADGFSRCGLAEIVAMAVPGNARSLAVMERIGMRRDPAGDFDHPDVSPGHALRPHVLYRIGPTAA